jgi:hypothetical protein
MEQSETNVEWIPKMINESQMQIHSSTIIAAVLFVLLGGSPAFPNTAPVKSVGKTIQPLNNVPVRMVSEDVRIRLSSSTAIVDCRFTLLNEGKPDTIEVGFPRGWEGDLIGFMAKNAKIRGLYSVETLAEEPSFGEYTGEKLPWWKVFKVPFESTGQTIVVENSYSTFVVPGGNSPNPLNDFLFTYIMKTGALWKGQIDSAKVTLYLERIPFDQVTKISPEGFTREGNRITWNFKDFKPSQNIEISIMQDKFYERLALARKILVKEPNSAFAHYLTGTVCFNRFSMDYNQLNEAEKELQTALSIDPNYLDAQWFLALVYIYKDIKSKTFKESKAQLEKMARDNPDYRCTDELYYQYEIFSSNNPKGLLESLIRSKYSFWKY